MKFLGFLVLISAIFTSANAAVTEVIVESKGFVISDVKKMDVNGGPAQNTVILSGGALGTNTTDVVLCASTDTDHQNLLMDTFQYAKDNMLTVNIRYYENLGSIRCIFDVAVVK